MSGVAIFLPHSKANEQTFDNIHVDIKLIEHGVSQIGPSGDILNGVQATIPKSDVRAWTGSKGCAKSAENQGKISIHCLPGNNFVGQYTTVG